MEYSMSSAGSLLWRCLMVFVLLTQHTSHSTDAANLTVDPPSNIRITDPGHLGYLTIEWNRPTSLENLTDCTVRYQLRFNSYSGRWRSVRTLGLSYEAQFDLNKPIQVKMLTLLKGECTEGRELLGQEVEVVHQPEHSGVDGSRISDFHCVYFNKEFMNCMWNSGPVNPPGSKHYLYYWHREMQETAECPEYISSPEFSGGCRFPPESLLEFSEFNICVNGSSAAEELEPSFFSLEVQNQVKPVVVSDVEVLVEEGLVQVQWSPPAGHVPEQCLEYELEATQENMDGNIQQWTNVTEETSIDIVLNGESKRNCFRIRSKVNGYCADEGYWSDWSRSECFPVFTETTVEENNDKSWNVLLLTVMLVIGVTGVLICSLMLWTLRKMWMKRKDHDFYTLYQEKVPKALLSPMFP